MQGEENLNRLSSQVTGREHFVSGLELWQWRQMARQQAIAANVPPTEVDWFLQAMSELDRLTLRLESFQARPQVALQRSWPELTRLWQQRVEDQVPVQYLTEVAPWRQFLLKVSPAVLIPRPETECLIDLALAATQATSLATGDWVDLGTGSGAIALGLATAFPQATIHAVDDSAEALAIAQANAQAYHLRNRIQFYQGSWFQPLMHLRGRLRGMVSNPPYIPSAMIPTLQPEVARHEPHVALDGGADGLECVGQLIETAPDYLQVGGVWLVELMAGQATTVAQRLQAQGCYSRITIHADLAGIDRFVLAYRQ